MRLVAVGANHRSAGLDLRGRIALDEPRLRCMLENLRADGADEAVALSTCNRTELYLAGHDAAALERLAVAELASAARLECEEISPALVRLRDDMAALHLCRVASGLDSLVPGEGEILGQVREALGLSLAAGAAGPVTTRAFERALQTGKRVRSETAIAASNASVSSVAAELARVELGGLDGRSAMLIGAGRTSELTALNLIGRGLRSFVVTNRTYAAAHSLAERLGGEAAQFDEMPGRLAVADVVISSTAAPHPIVHAPDVAAAMRERAGRPLLFIDLAVPRDIDPTVGAIEGCALHDLDDLRGVVARNLDLRRREAGAAEAICVQAADEFVAWQSARDVVPAIRLLRTHAEDMAAAEVERIASRWPDLDAAERVRLERLGRAIARKLLHHPTEALRRQAATSDGLDFAETARELFGLADDEA